MEHTFSHPAALAPTVTSLPGRDHRLARYCAAGVAAFAGAVTTADASIVFVDYNNQTLVDTAPGDTSFTLFPYDLDGNGTTDFNLANTSGNTGGGGAAIFLPTGGALDVAGASFSNFNYAARLGQGALIGPTTAFLTLTPVGFDNRASMASGTGFPNSQWASPSPSTGFLGIRFTGVGGTATYGWINLSVAGNTNPGARAITLIGAAYEDTGAAIAAGAVPEPSALALVALGGVGLTAYRHRRRRTGEGENPAPAVVA